MALPPLSPSLENFRALATQGNLIPVWTELLADTETPVSAFQKLDRGGYSFLLESAESSAKAGRYSFVGTARYSLVLTYTGHRSRRHASQKLLNRRVRYTENQRFQACPNDFKLCRREYTNWCVVSPLFIYTCLVKLVPLFLL